MAPLNTWHPIIRRKGVSALFQSYINQGYKDAYYEEILGVPHGLGSHRYVDGWVIVHNEHAEAFTSKFIPRLDQPPYVEYFLNTCARVSDELLALGAEIRTKSYESAAPSGLLFDFMRFGSRTIRVMPFLNTMVFVQDAIEERVLRVLSRHLGLGVDDPDLRAHMQALMAEGSRMPLASQAIAELGELAGSIRTSHLELAAQLATEPGSVTPRDVESASAEFSAALTRYLDAYDFLGTNYYLGSPTSFSDLCLQLAGFIENGPSPQDQDTPATPTIELGPEDRALLKTAQHLQYLREYRLEALYKAGRDCRELFTRIGEQLGTSYEETVFMTFDEIQSSLTGLDLAVSLTTIGARMEGYASCVEDERVEFVVGAELDRLRVGLPTPPPPANRLSGVTAFPGDVTGPARVVNELAQADDVQAGDILIAPMTMPYHVPAMSRSAAVITDEGGILSHAAIVARELRIPCVVGLQSATSAFRDGERLHVRATPAGGVVELAS